MEFFEGAKTVRLKSCHGLYLWAHEDCYKVFQCKEPKNILAYWRVEQDPGGKLIRLKSCHQTILTASDEVFVMGITGKKVVQIRQEQNQIDADMEWEPIKAGPHHVKLKSCQGNFLRANKGFGPSVTNLVTHDLPHRIRAHQNYLLWEVEVVWGASSFSSSSGAGSAD